jgi:hypothetical protein
VPRSVLLTSNFQSHGCIGVCGRLQQFSSLAQTAPEDGADGENSLHGSRSPASLMTHDEYWVPKSASHVVDLLQAVKLVQCTEQTKNEFIAGKLPMWSNFLRNHFKPLKSHNVPKLLTNLLDASQDPPHPRVLNQYLSVVAEQVDKSDVMSAEEVANMLERLHKLELRSPGGNQLLVALGKKVSACPDLFSAKQLKSCFLALDGRSAHAEVNRWIVGLLAKALQESLDHLDGDTLSSVCQSTRRFDAKHSSEVRLLQSVLLKRLASYEGQLTGPQYCAILGSLWSMDAESNTVVRRIFGNMASIIQSSHGGELEEENIGIALYGFSNSSSEDVSEVRDCLVALFPKIAAARGPIRNPHTIIRILKGLSKCQGKDDGSRSLLRVLATKLLSDDSNDEAVSPQLLTQRVMLLANKDSKDNLIAMLRLHSLRKLYETDSPVDQYYIRAAIVGLRGINPTTYNDSALFDGIVDKVAANIGNLAFSEKDMHYLLTYFVGNPFNRPVSCRMLHTVMQEVLAKHSHMKLSPASIGMLLPIFARVRSSPDGRTPAEVLRLLHWLTENMRACDPGSIPEHVIGTAMFDMHTINSESPEVRAFLSEVNNRMNEHKPLRPKTIARCLQGLQCMRADNEAVVSIIKTLASFIPHGHGRHTESFTEQDVMHAVGGIVGLDIHNEAVRQLWTRLADFVYEGGTQFSPTSIFVLRKMLHKVDESGLPAISAIKRTLRDREKTGGGRQQPQKSSEQINARESQVSVPIEQEPSIVQDLKRAQPVSFTQLQNESNIVDDEVFGRSRSDK